ncbi:MAG: hypothetical protein KatS3mg082_1464 [Nitrospiraceae bacterium]|nr:MAG: hypothetical protein KatS3mg082_1464 [Nitrospiraceae bacterium]
MIHLDPIRTALDLDTQRVYHNGVWRSLAEWARLGEPIDYMVVYGLRTLLGPLDTAAARGYTGEYTKVLTLKHPLTRAVVVYIPPTQVSIVNEVFRAPYPPKNGVVPIELLAMAAKVSDNEISLWSVGDTRIAVHLYDGVPVAKQIWPAPPSSKALASTLGAYRTGPGGCWPSVFHGNEYGSLVAEYGIDVVELKDSDLRMENLMTFVPAYYRQHEELQQKANRVLIGALCTIVVYTIVWGTGVFLRSRLAAIELMESRLRNEVAELQRELDKIPAANFDIPPMPRGIRVADFASQLSDLDPATVDAVVIR